MPLGMEIGIGPGHIVLDGDPAPPHGKGHGSSPLFGACLLWPNGRPPRKMPSSCFTSQRHGRPLQYEIRADSSVAVADLWRCPFVGVRLGEATLPADRAITTNDPLSDSHCTVTFAFYSLAGSVDTEAHRFCYAY